MKGLTNSQAISSLNQYGPNIILEQKKKPIYVKFLEQFNNFLTILLILASVFSFFIGEKIDGILIISIVVLNGLFGIYQEAKAEESIAALKKMTVTKVRVMRDGKEQEIDSKYLVPGDIVFVEEGTKIAADGVVVEALNLEVNEAALTGESIPVTKSEIRNPKPETNSNYQNSNLQNSFENSKFKNSNIVSNFDIRASNLIYSGTIVSKGRGLMRVTATGMHTKFGAIAATLSTIKDTETPLQKKLKDLTRLIGIVGIVLAVVVFIISFLEGTGYFPSFLLAISLAVAVVPEGLPAVMTITLAIGVKKMADKKSIIRKLSAIEALGSITLIATDKTGTLTTNKMKVKEIFVDGRIINPKSEIRNPKQIQNQNDLISKRFENLNFENSDIVSSFDIRYSNLKKTEAFDLLLLNGILCSTASLSYNNETKDHDVLGDPTEGALLYLAHDRGIDINLIKKEWKLIDEKPFDSVSKMMSVIVEKNSKFEIRNSNFAFSKGAPESILAICDKILIGTKTKKLSEQQKGEIEKQVKEWAKKGLRVLAFAYKQLKLVETGQSWLKLAKNKNPISTNFNQFKPISTNMTFLGLVAIHDAPRPEIVEAVKKAKEAGIKVVMITGDNEITAEAIGIIAGITSSGNTILTGNEIERLSDEQLLALLPKTTIFARTNPFQKHRIVKLYQKLGEIVAVTGDGVNDAIALKQADVGVAMGLVGTDVARETADMVITDDNFATIVNAIEEGRNIIKNLKNAIKYLLSCNMSEAIVLIVGLILGLPTILYAIQLLYINLVTDGLPALALGFSPRNQHVMESTPEKDVTLLKPVDKQYILFVGFFAAVLVFIAFYLFAGTISHFDRLAFTAAFSVLTLIQSFIFVDLWLSHRSLHRNIPLLLLPLFFIAFLIPFLLQFVIVSHPFAASVFKIQQASISQYLGFVFLSSLILVGIKGVKKIIRL